MRLDRIRSTTFQVTLHAYELATLVAAARTVVRGAEGELTHEARLQLETVLTDYDEAFRRGSSQSGASMYMMFVKGELNSGKRTEFVSTWNHQIIPLLKKQDGFVEEFLLFGEGSENACGLLFWNTQEQCARFQHDVFPQVKEFVLPLINGNPQIRGFNVEAADTMGVPHLK